MVGKVLCERFDNKKLHVYSSLMPSVSCVYYSRIDDDGSRLLNFLNAVDVVIYVSNIGTPVDSILDFPANTIKNCNFFLNFIAALKVLTKPIPWIIFISSGGAVYGNVEPILNGIKESHSCNPITPYGMHKFSMERWLQFAAQELGFNWNILRPANLYGKSLGDDRNQGVIGVWAKKLSLGDSICIPSSKNITRDYLHVDDFCNAIELLLKNRVAPNVIYNVGTNSGHSILDILDVFKIYFDDIKIVESELYDNPILWNVLNSDLLIGHVNWKPNYDLDTGISEFLSL